MNRPRHIWTPADDALLRELYPHNTAAVVAEQMGLIDRQVYHRAHRLRIEKSPEFLATHLSGRLGHGQGKASRFGPGHVPANKGVKGWHAGGRSVETQFKPGRPPHLARNYLPIGSLRITKDGYLERKMTDDQRLVPARRWTAVHRLVWEAEHGPIPHGMIVVFRPGQKTTVESEITLDRLELISRKENMLRNSFHRYPQPIPQLVRLRAALQNKINRRKRRLDDVQKQDRGSEGSPVRPARKAG